MAFRNMKPDPLTELAVRMKRGDRRAAAKLYDELLPKLYGFLFTRTGKREVAEDLAQDIFMRLIERIGAYDEARGAFVVWFWQMARNVLIDHYRKKQEVAFSKFEDAEVEAMAIDASMSGAALDQKFEHGRLTLFLKTLSPDERELFEYRYVAELSYGEIAELVGKSEGALRVAAMRVKEKIREGLNKKNSNDE